MGIISLFVLLFCTLAESAMLRSVSYDQNGRDVRFEVLVDRWWADRLQENVNIPAGTPVFNRTGTVAMPTNLTIPVDMAITVTNTTANGAARIVFPIVPTGRINLSITRFSAVEKCIDQNSSDCITCSKAAYTLDRFEAPFVYGTFQQPLGTPNFALNTTITSASGLHASILWNSSFPKNQLGVSSTENISAWTAYISGATGDTGRIVQDFLPGYLTFFSKLVPAGFIMPTVDSTLLQASLDRFTEEWIKRDCYPDTRDSMNFIYPYPTLASVITESTNQYYGQPVRMCSALQATNLQFQEIACSFDDIDLVIVVKLVDGAKLFSNIQSLSPPLPPPSMVPPRNNLTPPSPPPLLPYSPQTWTDPHAPTLAFVARFTNHAFSSFNMDLYKKELQTLLSVETDIRILSTWQLASGNQSVGGIAVNTVVVFKQASDVNVARYCQMQLVAYSQKFSLDLQPVEIDTPLIAAWGVNGCLLTHVDCGAHGTLYPQAAGCTCVCDHEWENEQQPMVTPFYCAVYSKHTNNTPPAASTSNPWRNISSAPPPAPKEYSNKSWSHGMGIAGWFGITGGVLGAGLFLATCYFYGKRLWTRCLSCCWHRPCSKHQAAYSQIQALRHQLQELQSHINAE